MITERRICPTCNTPFETTHLSKIYCQISCRPSRKGRPAFYKMCQICGTPFLAETEKTLFCTKGCRQRYMLTAPRAGSKAQGEAYRALLDIPASVPLSPLPGYRKDEDLFAQRLPYTFDGITWWATPCCYCGDPAEDEDHVLPLSAYKKLCNVSNISLPEDLLRIVPSCHECNLLLTDKVFRSFEEKRLYAKALIARRYHDILTYPSWTPEELAELTGSLHRWIGAGQDMRDSVFERLRF